MSSCEVIRTSWPMYFYRWVLLFVVLLPPSLLAEPDENTPSISILYGAYEIIGRAPGAVGPPYRGWIRIAIEQDRLSVDRCIAGTHSEGSGYLTTVPSGNTAVKFRYNQGQQVLEATCAYLNDFDNLPRFSCHTYPGGELAAGVPGLESAFPIVWQVPIDYFDCR
jgi:hypothetical protein